MTDGNFRRVLEALHVSSFSPAPPPEDSRLKEIDSARTQTEFLKDSILQRRSRDGRVVFERWRITKVYEYYLDGVGYIEESRASPPQLRVVRKIHMTDAVPKYITQVKTLIKLQEVIEHRT